MKFQHCLSLETTCKQQKKQNLYLAVFLKIKHTMIYMQHMVGLLLKLIVTSFNVRDWVLYIISYMYCFGMLHHKLTIHCSIAHWYNMHKNLHLIFTSKQVYSECKNIMLSGPAHIYSHIHVHSKILCTHTGRHPCTHTHTYLHRYKFADYKF